MKKTYVLILSRRFPKTHLRSGQPTGFIQNFGKQKKHTIRKNYKLWKQRSEEINKGIAVLSVRYWSGKPYRSKQVEICKLEKIAVEKLEGPDNFVFAPIEGNAINWGDVARNDGLSFEDFCEWFNVRQKEPMAVIHFTDFRYCTKP